MIRWIRLLLVLTFLVSASGLTPAAAQPGSPLADDPPPPLPNALQDANHIYLPMIVRSFPYTISGRVTDANQQPLSGVAITDNTGRTAVTDASGVYSLAVEAGDHSIAPSKEGYVFSPSMLDIRVNSNVVGQDFSAVADCSEAIVNGGFESSAWWDLLQGGYPASYSTVRAHSGLRSVRAGIVNSLDNRLADSFVRSPAISIPAGASSAVLRLWLFPVTTESVAAAQQRAEEVDSAFGDTTLMYDAQYVRVLNTSNEVIGTLLYIRSNNSAWSFHQFDLLPFAGQTVKIEVGAYNDGTEGVTALYVDDASLQLCAGAPPPPAPPDDCTNRIANSGFEYNGSWNIPITPYPAGYSYDYAHTGLRSMRTGIPLYTYSNVYSYSDAWQTISIPAGATNARLKMWLYPRSEEVAASTEKDEDDQALAAGAPQEGTVWGESPLAPNTPDAQYVLLLNPYTGAILQTLVWWTPRNSTGWLYREFDLGAYAGRSVRIQFGTYNDGYGGRSVMYVDDAVLEVCAVPPPTTCTERILNGGFETNAAWYIPLTNFSAGYSTWLRRTGLRSMRTGIVYAYHNRYSYSDFRQAVTIPTGTRTATLNFYAYSISSEAYSDAPLAERPTSGDLTMEAAAGDVQYLLVLDRWGNWIDTLLWRRSNEQYWRNFVFNLNRYIGSTIMLQWGTYNNGWDGVTAMYVDDVSLRACP
jgi:hypothetical protein